MLYLFLKGLLIGLAISAPVGPISLLCINRTLNYGFKVGIITGFGAACADGVYGSIAAFGLTAVSTFLVAQQNWIRLIGGIFLLYLGIKLFFKKHEEHQAKARSAKTLFSAYTSGFALTLANPMTILSFLAIFAGLQLGSTYGDYTSAMVLVVGIVSGSMLWEFFMSGTVAFILHKRVSHTMMKIINWLSGGIICTFGVVTLL